MNQPKKDDLHALVDMLPETEVSAAHRFLQFLQDSTSTAELSDEAERELEEVLARGIEQGRQGKTVSLDTALAKLI